MPAVEAVLRSADAVLTLQREEQAPDEDSGRDAGAEVEPDVHLRADEAQRRQDSVAADDRLRLRSHRQRRVRGRGTSYPAGPFTCSLMTAVLLPSSGGASRR